MINQMKSLQWTRRYGADADKVDKIYLRQFGSKYEQYRILWEKANRGICPDFPLHLDFEIIDACNLRCLYCIRNDNVRNKLGIIINSERQFPLNSFVRIMNEARLHKLMAINLGAFGEPFLNPHLLEMISIAHKGGVIDIRLISNGTLVTQEMLPMILKSKLTFLSFSIDAGRRKTYKLLKGEDYFDKLRNVVDSAYHLKRKLKKPLPLIRASFYSCAENRNEEKLFMRKFQNIVDFIDFQSFQRVGKIKKGKVSNICHQPFCRLAIFPNGDVAPCCSFYSKKLIVGNIKKMSLKEIWDSENLKQIRRSLLDGEPMDTCKECMGTIYE